MSGPGWLSGIFAALMLTVATYCTGRLVAARVWRRPTELDTDSAHVVMGVAMAGMLVSALRAFPSSLWEGVFAAGAGWFGYQALRSRRGAPGTPWRCLQPAPHLVECAAMLYVLLAVRPAATFVPLLLAVFLLGWAVRLADGLAVRVPAFAVALGGPVAGSGVASRQDMPLAPRCAALCSMAMGITMGYMLIMLL
jgi:Domain of unknown function (DUF5134)